MCISARTQTLSLSHSLKYHPARFLPALIEIHTHNARLPSTLVRFGWESPLCWSTKSPSAAGQQGHIGAQSRRRMPFECAAQIKQINVRTSSGATGVCLRAHTAGLPPPRSRAVPEAGLKGKSVAQESEQQQKSRNKEPARRQERGGYGARVNARESPPQSRGYRYGRGPLGHCPCAPRRWRP
jgi:hypothetical protein